MAAQQDLLDNLKLKMLKDNICPELAKTAHQLVFGEGSSSAKIVFIGEAPGKNEDEQGRPFVGAAGKFFDEMLEMINLTRDSVYITNIVKYRPPNNRDPLPEEKAVFLPYLYKQLEIIRPQMVVTLGRHSLNCFLPDLVIGKVHGLPKRMKVVVHGSAPRTMVILPLFHPAAALYNGGMRQTLVDDFVKIPVIMSKINEF